MRLENAIPLPTENNKQYQQQKNTIMKRVRNIALAIVCLSLPIAINLIKEQHLTADRLPLAAQKFIATNTDGHCINNISPALYGFDVNLPNDVKQSFNEQESHPGYED